MGPGAWLKSGPNYNNNNIGPWLSIAFEETQFLGWNLEAYNKTYEPPRSFLRGFLKLIFAKCLDEENNRNAKYSMN